MTTCEERIDERLRERIAYLHAIQRWVTGKIDKDNIKLLQDLGVESVEESDAWQALNEWGIALTLTTNTHGAKVGNIFKQYVTEFGYAEKDAARHCGQAILVWELSWGGPADGFVVMYERSPYWRITEVTYYFPILENY